MVGRAAAPPPGAGARARRRRERVRSLAAGSAEPRPRGLVSGGLPSASLVENARFNALGRACPNAAAGDLPAPPRGRRARRPRPTSTAGRSACSAGMRRSYDGGPVWVRVIRDPALLAARRPTTSAACSRARRTRSPPTRRRRGKGWSHFQPDALTISRGEQLGEPPPLHRGGARHRPGPRTGSPSGFVRSAREEAEALLAEAGGARRRARVGRVAPRVPADHPPDRPRRRARATTSSCHRAAGRADGRGELDAGRAARRASSRSWRRLARLRRARRSRAASCGAVRRGARRTRTRTPPGQLPHWLFAMQRHARDQRASARSR